MNSQRLTGRKFGNYIASIVKNTPKNNRGNILSGMVMDILSVKKTIKPRKYIDIKIYQKINEANYLESVTDALKNFKTKTISVGMLMEDIAKYAIANFTDGYPEFDLHDEDTYQWLYDIIEERLEEDLFEHSSLTDEEQVDCFEEFHNLIGNFVKTFTECYNRNHIIIEEHNLYHDIDMVSIAHFNNKIFRVMSEYKFCSTDNDLGLTYGTGHIPINELDISAFFQNIYYYMMHPVSIYDEDFDHCFDTTDKCICEYININTGIHMRCILPEMKYADRLQLMQSFADKYGYNNLTLCNCDKCSNLNITSINSTINID